MSEEQGSFGGWLKTLRGDRRMTNAELAHALGVGEITLARMFETEHASWVDRVRVLIALGVSVPPSMHADSDPAKGGRYGSRGPQGLSELEEQFR